MKFLSANSLFCWFSYSFSVSQQFIFLVHFCQLNSFGGIFLIVFLGVNLVLNFVYSSNFFCILYSVACIEQAYLLLILLDSFLI